MSMLQKPIQELLNFSLINIDKPAGPTSFQISQYIKDALNLDKTSHMGTLDPQVTGVLPITLGRACKLSEYFMHRDKEYVGIIRTHKNIQMPALRKEAETFIGKINQIPPVRSRVKREVREREIKSFTILEKTGKDFVFIASVQAGTYIRKLVHDLGERIGGAHMLELRRTRASIFTEKSLVNLYQFDSIVSEYKKGNEAPLREILVPAEEAIKKVLPSFQLSEKNLKAILTGKPLMKSDFVEQPKSNGFAAFVKERFVGIYHKVDEGDIIARPEFVFN
jgi:H/ACA ribonucleoprotein complex subunit 4